MKIRIIMIMAVLMGCLQMNAKQYKLPVAQFDKIYVDDNINVVYVGHDGSPSRVTYEGDQKYARAFIITQNGDKLKIQVETIFVDDPELPTLYLYSNFLEKATISSDAKLTIESAAPGSQLDLTLIGNGSINAENLHANKVSAYIKSGNGTITLSGTCELANLTMFGNGTIQADRLQASTVNCKIFGTGSIGCWAENLLKVKGIGSTKIYYKGAPIISKKGGGKLFPLDIEESDSPGDNDAPADDEK